MPRQQGQAGRGREPCPAPDVQRNPNTARSSTSCDDDKVRDGLLWIRAQGTSQIP